MPNKVKRETARGPRGPYAESPSYVIRRQDGGFEYRRHVPTALQGFFGRRVWCKWLGTSRVEAFAEGRKLAVEHDDLIASARALSEPERQHIAASRAAYAGKLTAKPPGTRDPASWARGKGRELRGFEAWGVLQKITKGPPSDLALADFFGDMDPPRDNDTPDSMRLEAMDLAREWREEGIRLRVEGDKNLRIARKLAGGTASIFALVELWQHVTKPRAQKSIDKANLYVRRFVELVGDIEPAAVTRQHAARYRDALEAPALKLSSASVAKHLHNLSRLFSVALSRNVVASNPFAGIKASKGEPVKFSDDASEKTFTATEVRLIFERLPELPHDDQIVMRFLAYHGARSGEVCQLRACDLAYQHGVDTVTLTDAGEGASVKNRSSFRTIPLHLACREELVALAKSKVPDAYLFDYPGWAHTRAGKFQQRGNAWLHRIGIADKTLHTWRHTWRTLAGELEMPERISCAIMGHALGKGEHGKYGAAPSLKRLAEWLAKIDPLAG